MSLLEPNERRLEGGKINGHEQQRGKMSVGIDAPQQVGIV